MAEEIVADTTENVNEKDTQETQAEENNAGSEHTDYEKIIAEQNAKIAKLEENNSNLTKGISKWKKVAKSENSYEEPEPLDTEKLETFIDQKVAQKIAESQLADAIKQRDETLSKMARELREAKLALKNQPNSPTSTGTHTEKPEVKTEFFTKEQLEELKTRGVDPQKVIENYKKLIEK